MNTDFKREVCFLHQKAVYRASDVGFMVMGITQDADFRNLGHDLTFRVDSIVTVTRQ